jgi:hypothetical protein
LPTTQFGGIVDELMTIEYEIWQFSNKTIHTGSAVLDFILSPCGLLQISSVLQLCKL